MYKKLLLSAILAASMCGCVSLSGVDTDVAQSDVASETTAETVAETDVAPEAKEVSETATDEPQATQKVDASGAAEGYETRDMSMPYAPESSGQAEPGDGVHLFVAAEWPETDVTAGIPVPSFADAPSDVSITTNSVHVEWKNVSEADAAAYVESIKQAGFIYQFSETRGLNQYSFNASDAETTVEGTKSVGIYYSRYSMSAYDGAEETEEITFSMDVSVCDWSYETYA